MFKLVPTTYIYALVDPRDGRIRYIGKSNDPDRRLLAHMAWEQNRNSRKSKWIRELLLQKLKPLVVILQVVPDSEWRKHEESWIERLSHLDLLNAPPGGRIPWTEQLAAMCARRHKAQ